MFILCKCRRRSNTLGFWIKTRLRYVFMHPSCEFELSSFFDTLLRDYHPPQVAHTLSSLLQQDASVAIPAAVFLYKVVAISSDTRNKLQGGTIDKSTRRLIDFVELKLKLNHSYCYECSRTRRHSSFSTVPYIGS